MTDEGRKPVWLAKRVSDRVGRKVSRQAIHNIIHGYPPAEDEALAIAEALGREIGDVFPPEIAA